MNDPLRTAKATLLVVAMLLGAAVSGSVQAQQPTTNLTERITGAWTVVSQYVEQDGKKLEPFGASPKGLVVYDRSGRFSLVLQSAALPKLASGNRMTGTPDENRAIVQGSIAYFGRYSVNEGEGTINLHFDGCTFPNWDGIDQTRLLVLSGDDLKVTSPTSTVGGGTVHLILRRVR